MHRRSFLRLLGLASVSAAITPAIAALPKPGLPLTLPQPWPPVGTLQNFYGPLPRGWLPCDGREVSRTHYVALFELLGTNHGNGDGETTFNLPNFWVQTPPKAIITLSDHFSANDYIQYTHSTWALAIFAGLEGSIGHGVE